MPTRESTFSVSPLRPSSPASPKSSLDSLATSGDANQVDIFHACCHPSEIPRYLFYSLGGSQWKFLARTIRLWPLKFRDAQVETEYLRDCLLRHRNQFPFISLCTFGALLNVWIWYGLGCGLGWIELHFFIVSLSFHILTAILVAIQVALAFVPFIEKWAKWTEEIWYVVQTITLATISFWLSWVIKYADLHTDFDANPDLYLSFLELRLLTDLLSTGIYAFFLLQADCLLDSTTRKSIYFHIAMWIVYSLSRLWQATTFRNHALTTLNFMDAFLTFVIGLTVFLFRWFQEANHRARFMMVRESRMRVERVKNARNLITRRATRSAAEEIINVMNTVKEGLAKRKADGAVSGMSDELLKIIEESERDLTESITKLADGANGEVIKKGSGRDVGDDQQISTFVDMYRNEGTAALVQRNSAKTRRRKTVVARPGRAGNITITPAEDSETQNSGSVIRINDVDVPTRSLQSFLEGKVGSDFTFRMLDVATKTKHILTEVGGYLLAPYLDCVEVPEPVMLGFLYALEITHWGSNPFKNPIHAAHVSHSFVTLLHMVDLFDHLLEIERFAYIVAALGHAAGHAGRGASFYISSNAVLAWAQNDLSVIEHLTCFVLNLMIKSCPEVNLVANLSLQEQQVVRKLMTDAIMGLDMTKHFEMLSKWRVRRASPDFDLVNEGDRQLAAQIVFKTAELGYTMVDWSQHQEWCLRQCEEHYQQGDHEVTLGIDISPLCDRKEHLSWPSTVVNYLQYVMMPLLEDLSLMDAGSETVSVELVTRLLLNRQRWEILVARKKTEPIPPEILKLPIAPPHWGNFQILRTMWAKTLKDLTVPISKEALRKIGAKVADA